MSCLKALLVITGSAHCFCDYKYITLISLMLDLGCESLLTTYPLILRFLLGLFNSLWFTGTSNAMCNSISRAQLQEYTRRIYIYTSPNLTKNLILGVEIGNAFSTSADK